MKAFTLILSLLISLTGFAQVDLPINFEDMGIDYDLTDFGGNNSSIVVDPTDASNMVGQAIKTDIAELWAGTTMGDAGLANPIAFGASATTMTVRVWSPDAGIPVRLKVEDASDAAISVETEATTTMAMAWETLTFDFANQAAGTAAINFANTYNKISIFFNFGTTGADAGEKTYYWDDVIFVGGGGGMTQVDLPVTFEDANTDYNLTDFGGNNSSIVVDPTDASNMVGQAIKTDIAELWAGTTMGDGGLANAIAFSASATTMTVRVWSPDAGIPVRLKVEDASDAAISVETEATTTMAMAWETLSFDFTNQAAGTAALDLANTYNKISIFFNFGTTGADAGEKTYYWDDVSFDAGGGVTQVDLPVTFEDTNTDYDLTDFGGNSSSIVVDPTDASNMVGQAIKTDIAELWAGTTMGDGGLANAIAFSASATTMTVRVWSPDAGTPIRLKVEDASNAGISVETEATTTMAMAWETLTFDFNNQAAGTAALDLANTYNKISIFFNFGTTGADAGEKTYYWDDVIFVGGGGGMTQVDLPVTFEDANTDYDLTDFGGNNSSIVVDPTDASNMVGQAIKTDIAELWAGTTMGDGGLANPIAFSASATTMTVRVWSPDAGTPIRLKVEDASNAGISVETEATTTMAMAWETLTFDFNNPAAGTAALDLANTYNKISIFFNFGTTGADAGEKTYYWDDVIFDSGTGMTPLNLPITFEDANVDYNLTDFGGNNSSIVVDPTNANNMVGQAIKTDIAELWAGTTMGDSGLANPIEFSATATTISVRVWSPDAGTPIRLKVEDATDAGISVETEATTTMAMAWEVLVFDFNNEAAGTAALDLANTYDKISIFFNFGTTGADAGEKTYYWDDVTFVGEPTLNQVDLPITFEDADVDYSLTDFGGNASSIVVDPTDATNMVGQAIKTDMAETFAGTTMGNDGLANPVPFNTTSTSITVRVWSPDAGTPVRLKVENAMDAAISVETEATTMNAMAWDTLTFDFANPVAGTPALSLANTYDKITIFFNFGTSGADAGEKTYYWDDVTFVPGPMLDQVDLPITFEDANVDYGLTDFAGNASSIVVDPTDATNMVGQAIKTDMAETFAGTTMGNFGLVNPVPFTPTSTSISVRVWSPDAGTPVRLKVEDATNAAISVETEVMTMNAMAWDTLTFDFANPASGTAALDLANTYDKITIFFNFGTTGADAGEKTYYWDDVMFVEGPMLDQVDLPITFEDANTDYSLTDFGGNASSIVVDPTDAGNMVGQAIKTDMAETFAGTTMGNFGLVNPIAFSATSTTISVRVWSPDAGTPIRLKVEDTSNGAISVETEETTTTAMAWETLEFDFDNEVAGTPALDLASTYNKITIFFNFGTTGADAGEKTYYWDDVIFVEGPPLEQINLPVTFEASNVDYDLTDFGGNASSIVTDPTDPANTVAQSIKTDMAETFAGTTMGGNGFVDAVPFTDTDTKMTVRVWSPDAGITVRLKVEDATNGAISVETDATTTVAMAWETLEFDFSNEAAGTSALDLANTYDKASIFFNFGTTGADAGEKTYYWDDVEFGPRVTVVDIVVNSPDHETLEMAVIAAELADDLSGAGPFTVFAPTDEAFDAVDPDVLANLLENPTGNLAQILLYHVLGDEVYAADMTDGEMRATLQGEDVTISITGGDVMINQALVTLADLEADNGVVHVINAVLLPPNFVGIDIVNAAERNIKVMPNPASTHFFVELPEDLQEEVQFGLYDLNGRIVQQGVLRDSMNTINTSALSPGTYFLKMDASEGSFYQKVMIAK